MKKSLFLCLVVFTLLFVVGCGRKDPIVGKWAYGSGSTFVFTFNEDKTCNYTGNGKNCTYTVDGDKLSILYEGETSTYDTTFRIEGDKLIMIDSFGSEVVYNKK